MPNVIFFLAGAVIYVVLTLVPIISSTLDWISGSVILLMCPFLTIDNKYNIDMINTDQTLDTLEQSIELGLLYNSKFMPQFISIGMILKDETLPLTKIRSRIMVQLHLL